MTEEVYITGSNLPAWASETTLQGLLTEARAQGGNIGTLVQLLRTANSDNGVVNAVNELKKTNLRNNVKETAKRNQDNISNNRDDAQMAATVLKGNISRDKTNKTLHTGFARLSNIMGNVLPDKFGKHFSSLADWQRDRTRALTDPEFAAEREERIQEGGGMLARGLAGVGQVISTLASIGSVAVNYTKDSVEERVAVGREFTQIGVRSAEDGTFSSMALAINNVNFALDDMVGMARDFSEAVGVHGVVATANFVDSMRPELITDYNLEFGEIVDASGRYLDVQRQLGQLSGMSTGQMQSGMRDFMDTALELSNVLKISLPDAIEQLHEGMTNPRNRVMSAIVGAPEELRNDVSFLQNSLGDLGGIIGRLAIDPNTAMLDPQVQQMLSAEFSSIRPMIEDFARRVRNEENAADIIGDYATEMRATLDNDPAFTQMVAMGSEIGTALYANLLSISDNISDANRGLATDATQTQVMETLEGNRVLSTVIQGAISTAVDSMEAAGSIASNYAALEGVYADLVNTATSENGWMQTLANAMGGLGDITLRVNTKFHELIAAAAATTVTTVPDNDDGGHAQQDQPRDAAPEALFGFGAPANDITNIPELLVEGMGGGALATPENRTVAANELSEIIMSITDSSIQEQIVRAMRVELEEARGGVNDQGNDSELLWAEVLNALNRNSAGLASLLSQLQ